MRILVAALSGGLFGLGLLVSGMTDTARVQGFLDLFGHWDPTLAFVLGGAIAPMLFAWRLTRRHPRAVLGGQIPAMPEQVIDARLLTGSALFGLGWALAGFCPGPAIAALTFSGIGGGAFVAAMIAGMGLFAIYERLRQRAAVTA
ncbi:YeeE/YedE family protein [Defluviimonas sp. 20V17]|uniref:Membrane protein n=1 Tax=Allgaiera indica TaxID=765699 RepID=A0AAN4UP80_9RHOB|nr:DUF6691 family protein [Allgaiera indica]KDB04048.1 YeeE/YedE family protein [Defluviimonas sp. 20V17]GHD99407.1 membrane protein [Allgaiera indica]SDW26639.1 hypothetical protein SAMN05444006_102210 [Allgaiera indica]